MSNGNHSVFGSKTFFEHIGLSDMERVHSQMFQWYLGEDCNAISKEGQVLLVKKFLGLNVTEIKRVLTEHKSVDIIIETPEHVIAIENKVKSSQHSNQLERYDEVIREEYDKKGEYFFLTLVDEPSKIVGWNNITYSDLAMGLSEVIDSQSPHGQILAEYINTLKRLTHSLEMFLSSPMDFPNVFNDGAKKKIDKDFKDVKMYPNEVSKIIGMNQLETIFQKAYFQRVANMLELKEGEEYYILETHGSAILGVHVMQINQFANKETIEFDFGIDFQSGTVKVFVAAVNYNNSSLTMIPDSIKNAFLYLKGKYNFDRVNKPRSKAQFSMTKRLSLIRDEPMPTPKEFLKVFLNWLELARDISQWIRKN